MSTTVYIDIETATAPEVMRERCLAAGPFVNASAGIEWVEAHASDEALNPFLGRVICWAFITNEDEERSATDCGCGERELLAMLGELLPRDFDRAVAHNGHGFDFPFLRARALAVGLPGLARRFWQSKPWDGLLIDTLDESWCPRPRREVKGWTLDALADLLDIGRVSSIPGSEVPAAWYSQEFDAIERHCLDDVRVLREVTKKLAESRGE